MLMVTLCMSPLCTLLSSVPEVSPFPEKGSQTLLAMYMKIVLEVLLPGNQVHPKFSLLRTQVTLIASTEIKFSHSDSFLLKMDDFFPGQLKTGVHIPFKKHCPIPIPIPTYRSVVWL